MGDLLPKCAKGAKPMPPSDDYWYKQGRNGGSIPDSNSPDRAQEKYNEGKAQRDFDRMVDDWCKPKPYDQPFKSGSN